MDARTVKAARLHQPWSGAVLPTLLVDKLSQSLFVYSSTIEPTLSFSIFRLIFVVNKQCQNQV